MSTEKKTPDDNTTKNNDAGSPHHTQDGREGESRMTTDLYITGWKLHAITFLLLFMTFLAQMESTITSTAVITITNDLGGYLKSSWMLTAYWLTSGAFQIIWAKISDTVGRKRSVVAAVCIFTAFSGACGASHSVIQLIMYRWVQGIGGCGIMVLGQLLFFELVPPERYPLYIALVSAVIGLSLVTGPLIGGGITVNGNWRWVFLLNVPVGVVAIAGLIWVFPRQLFNEPAAHHEALSFRSMKRVDFLGCILLLGFCLLLTTGLQQAAVGYSFGSAFVLPLLICAGPFLIAFLIWQWLVTTRYSFPEPVFPWRFCQSRARLGLILISWTNGAILSTCVVQIPQRFMTVNGLSPLAASARFLALGAFVPGGSVFGVILMSRLKLRPYMVAGGAVLLQIIGTVFLSRANTEVHIQSSQYGLQVLIGTGVGLIISTVVTMIPFVMEEQDIPVATAAQSQFRILGGLVAVSIAATITTRYLESHLSAILPAEMVGLLLQRTEAIHMIPPETLSSVRDIFGKAFNQQMYMGVGLAAAQVPFVAMMWTKEPVASVETSVDNSLETETNRETNSDKA